MCEHQGDRSLYVHRTCWLFLCQSCTVPRALIISQTNERLRKVALSLTACNMTEAVKKANTRKHHEPGRRQAIITSAGTKRELLIGVKTHTPTGVMGIRWSWHLLTRYTESRGEKSGNYFLFSFVALQQNKRRYKILSNWKLKRKRTQLDFWRVETLLRDNISKEPR